MSSTGRASKPRKTVALYWIPLTALIGFAVGFVCTPAFDRICGLSLIVWWLAFGSR